MSRMPAKHAAVSHALQTAVALLHLAHVLVVQVLGQPNLAEDGLQQRHAVQTQLAFTPPSRPYRRQTRVALVVEAKILEVERVPDLLLALIRNDGGRGLRWREE